MVSRFTMLAFALFAITCFSETAGWAGTKQGDHIALPEMNFSVQGRGVSVEEVMNSLTDMNGLLASFTVKNSGRVTFDNPEPTVEGNHIEIPYTYHELGGHHRNSSGTLVSSEYAGCGDRARGKQLTLNSDPPKNADDKIAVAQTVFLVCAKNSANGVQLHVSSYLVAGPNWTDRAIEVSKILFANLAGDFQKHAVSYADQSSSAISLRLAPNRKSVLTDTLGEYTHSSSAAAESMQSSTHSN